MTPRQKNIIVVTLGALAAISPFSIDMYLPSFPIIAEEFNTTVANIALTLTAYFVGIGVGQILYGPILDRFGRKKPLQIGLLIYIVASGACSLTKSTEWLIATRVVQALGGCVGMVVGRAMVRDLFPVKEIARIFSLLILVLGVAPIIAPTVGSLVVTFLSWRYLFVLLMLVGFLLLVATSRLLPESRQPDLSVSLRPRAVFRDYWQVTKELEFLIFGVTSAVTMAGMFTYIAGSPFVYMELFGLTKQHFGWAFSINAFGLIMGSQINRLILKRYSTVTVCLAAGVAAAGIGFILLIGTAADFLQAPGTFVMVFLYLFVLGFVAPNASALAMEPFTKFAGSASALLGALQMFMGALASALVSYLGNGTALPMVEVMALCAFTGLAAQLARFIPGLAILPGAKSEAGK